MRRSVGEDVLPMIVSDFQSAGFFPGTPKTGPVSAAPELHPTPHS